MKRKLLYILCLFAYKITFSQNTNEINRSIKISDSLTFNKELRIYQSASITNHSSVFRIYQEKDKKWTIEYFKFYKSFDKNKNDRFEKFVLSSKTNLNIFWFKILDTDIVNLPQWDKISYKFKKRGKIVYDNSEYVLMQNRTQVLDGNSYIVSIKNFDSMNSVNYGNPESYFKLFPKVDELESFMKLLTLIRKEFKDYK